MEQQVFTSQASFDEAQRIEALFQSMDLDEDRRTDSPAARDDAADASVAVSTRSTGCAGVLGVRRDEERLQVSKCGPVLASLPVTPSRDCLEEEAALPLSAGETRGTAVSALKRSVVPATVPSPSRSSSLTSDRSKTSGSSGLSSSFREVSVTSSSASSETKRNRRVMWAAHNEIIEDNGRRVLESARRSSSRELSVQRVAPLPSGRRGASPAAPYAPASVTCVAEFVCRALRGFSDYVSSRTLEEDIHDEKLTTILTIRFVERVIKYAESFHNSNGLRVSHKNWVNGRSSLAVALVLINRLATVCGGVHKALAACGPDTNIRGLLLTAVVLALKNQSDQPVSLSYWGSVGGFSKAKLYQIELSILKELKWNSLVSQEEEFYVQKAFRQAIVLGDRRKALTELASSSPVSQASQ